MKGFELHPRLAADTHRLGRLDLSVVLLHRDAGVPWYLLVPMVDVAEMIDLLPAQRERLNTEIQRLCEFVREEHHPDRLNIATIGNQVPQLHVHVVARHQHDPCWPGVVWGRLATERRYDDSDVDARSTTLAKRLGMRVEPGR
ncbi:HIT domain-containing protein [Halofilum ochraceum]|uniref:HIT domain-containing protein n=1 Tax=Halofilum ochraceum TaxID=1611323 RepID=UPI0008D956B7|nr:HIT family protein [Halofilum ochraceum]